MGCNEKSRSAWAQLRPLPKSKAKHSSIEVCPSLISENYDSEAVCVDVIISSENDLVIECGDEIALAFVENCPVSVPPDIPKTPEIDACPSMPLRSQL